jgi:SAM-dependent methyltransferase
VTDTVSNPWDSRIAASVYDRIHTLQDDVELFVALAREAGGPILEIACGTGRCLIPIIRDGFDTVGIDAAEPMLDRLRNKLADEPDATRYRATPMKGDGRTFMLPLRFGMAFIAANSFTHFLTKVDQERLIGNVFQHLRPGGLFAIDVFNPGFDRLSRRETRRTQVGEYLVIQEDRSVD